MNKDTTLVQVLTFLQTNWFKLTIIGIGLYLFLFRGMTLHVQMQAPENAGQQHVSQPKEKITEKAASSTALTGETDRLEIPFFGKRKDKRNAMELLMEVDETTRHDYLERFHKVALQEQEKYGIPASVILAVSLYQSAAGTRDIVREAHNHFALPCSKDWRSACKSVSGASYRKYESAWYSFRDFSKYLEANFANLRGGNYINFANALQEAGFGSDPQIGENIVKLIEGYRLGRVDAAN